MNTFKMHHLLLVPMIILAVNACAKRDSNFGKKDPAAPATSDKVLTDSAKREAEGADGALTYAVSCKNPLKVTPTEGTEAILIGDLIKDTNKGTYTLVTTQYFSEAVVKEGDAPEQIAAQGNEYKTPEGFSAAVTDNSKINIICHTTKPVAGKEMRVRGSMDFANSFSAADGKGTVMRQDTVVASNGKLTTLSTLYSGNTDLKDSLGEGKEASLNVLILKNTKTHEVTILKQSDRADKDGKKLVVWMSATYALSEEKKDEPKADTAETTETVETPRADINAKDK